MFHCFKTPLLAVRWLARPRGDPRRGKWHSEKMPTEGPLGQLLLFLLLTLPWVKKQWAAAPKQKQLEQDRRGVEGKMHCDSPRDQSRYEPR